MTSSIVTRMAVALLVCAAANAQAGEPPPAANVRVALNIKAQPVREALQAFGEQTGLQVLYRSEGVSLDGVKVSPVSGELSAAEALTRMLATTGLKYEFVNERTVRVSAAGTESSKSDAAGEERQRPSGVAPAQSESRQAPEANNQNPKDSSASAESEASDAVVEEIVVTATKRIQRLQDVPLSITAITASEIDQRGLVSSEDYLRGIPGANQVTDAFGGGTIVIRGIETSPVSQNFSSGPTTATYFGETPTTSSAGLAGNMNVDLKLIDIERVEVLRGPQGTAFGNASLGGAVRTIPVEPRADRVEGKVAVGYSGTAGEGGDNTLIQATGNLPIIEGKLAVRASAFRHDNSGFYRNVAGSDAAFRAAAVTPYAAQAFAVDQDDVGSSTYTGGRIAALFQVSDDLKFTLMHLKQKTEIDGVLITGTGGSAFGSTRAFDQAVLQVAPEHTVRGRNGPVSDTDIDLSNAVMEYNLGWGSLLATVSHIDSQSTNTTPYTWCCAALPISTLAPSDHRETVGEVRLATQLDGAWDFLGGVYAEKLDDNFFANYVWYADPATNLPAPGERALGDYYDKRELTQTAAFGEVSWRFAPNWTLTGGMRAYDYERKGRVDTTPGAFTGGASTTITDADASGSTFRGNLSYKPTDTVLLYGGWAQGFRLGSPQPGLLATCDGDNDGVVDGSTLSLASTRSTRSDEVDNYELGAKFSLLDRRVTIAADVYRMDWTGVPIRINVGTCGSYTANAGAARSQGVEVQASFQVTPAFRVDLGVSHVNAELTKDAPILFSPAFKGDRLPGSPRVNGNLSLQYELSLFEQKTLVRLDSIYVGDFYGDLQETANNKAGGYVKADASVRVAFDNLTLDVFVRNLTNEDDYTFRYLGFPSHGYRLRPRTVGLQLAHEF